MIPLHTLGENPSLPPPAPRDPLYNLLHDSLLSSKAAMASQVFLILNLTLILLPPFYKPLCDYLDNLQILNEIISAK